MRRGYTTVGLVVGERRAWWNECMHRKCTDGSCSGVPHAEHFESWKTFGCDASSPISPRIRAVSSSKRAASAALSAASAASRSSCRAR